MKEMKLLVAADAPTSPIAAAAGRSSAFKCFQARAFTLNVRLANTLAASFQPGLAPLQGCPDGRLLEFEFIWFRVYSFDHHLTLFPFYGPARATFVRLPSQNATQRRRPDCPAPA